MTGYFRYYNRTVLGSGGWVLSKVPPINAGKNSIFGSLPPKIEMISYIPRNTWKYPKVKKMPENTWSYVSTLLPDPNLTRYLVFFPITDPIMKNPTRWSSSSQWITQAWFPTVQFVVLFCTIPCLKPMPIFLHTIYSFTTRQTQLRKSVSNNMRSAIMDKILIYT